MSLEETVMAQMKDAMKAKDEATLRGLRAIKAEIIKAKAEPGAGGSISADAELKIYKQQHRTNIAQKEEEEITLIEKFLPKQMSEAELKDELRKIITETG